MGREFIQSVKGGKVVTVESDVAAGVDGVKETVARCRRLAREGATDPLIRNLALSIVAGVEGHGYEAEAEAVQRWVQEHIRYVKDPAGTEWLSTPAATLMQGQKDCDGHSVLVAALLSAIGHEVRLVAVTFEAAPGRFAHIFTEDHLGGEWLAVETTRPYTLGQQPQHIAKRMTARLAAGAGIEGLLRFFRRSLNPITQLRDDVSRVRKYGPAVVMGAVQGFATGGPYGAIAGAVIAAGSQAVGEAVRRNREKKDAAQFESDVTNAANDIATRLGRPELAGEIRARLIAAGPNAQDEVAKIVNEFAGPAMVSKAMIEPAQVSAVTASGIKSAVVQVTPAGSQWWKDPRAQAGGVALLGVLFTVAMTRARQRSVA